MGNPFSTNKDKKKSEKSMTRKSGWNEPDNLESKVYHMNKSHSNTRSDFSTEININDKDEDAVFIRYTNKFPNTHCSIVFGSMQDDKSMRTFPCSNRNPNQISDIIFDNIKDDGGEFLITYKTELHDVTNYIRIQKERVAFLWVEFSINILDHESKIKNFPVLIRKSSIGPNETVDLLICSGYNSEWIIGKTVFLETIRSVDIDSLLK